MLAAPSSIDFPRKAALRKTRPTRLPLGLAVVVLSVCATTGRGQAGAPLAPGTRVVPSISYFAIFPTYFDGQYTDALKAFRREGRGGIKTVESNWIDSICYHTMSGECLYQLGQWEPALEHYSAALKLYLAFPDWMVRVQFPPDIAQASAQLPPPWGQSKRGALLGKYPDTIVIAQGQLDNTQAFSRGGVVQRPMYWPLNVVEVVRATCLAMRRYRQILGPAADQDPLAKQLVLALSRRPGPVNHWSEVWIDLQTGLANLAAGKIEQARPALQRAVVANGQFDHPLTSTALLELGRLALAEGDLAKAAQLAEEATYSAYYYRDPSVLEEAFALGTTTHLLGAADGDYPALLPAAAWARTADYRQLTCALLTMSAECHAQQGRIGPAAQTLADARALMGNRDLLAGRLGARANYVSSMVSYAQQNRAAGDQALQAALAFQLRGGICVARLAVVDRWLASGTISPRVAVDLYRQFLAEPVGPDWRLEPLESLTRLVMPQTTSLENWFEALLARKDWAAAVEVAEQIRRERFWSRQPLGGRLLALRWALEAPAEWLPPPSQLERQELLLRYPPYAELAQQAHALRRQLQADGPATDDEARRKQSQVLDQLLAISTQQEDWLRTIAVRRESVTQVFPPYRSAPQLQSALGEREVLLAFLQTNRHLYGYLIARDRIQFWQADTPTALQKRAIKLLRELALTDAGRPVALDQLAKEGYRQAAADLFEPLLAKSKLALGGDVDRLIVVPDGLLWYLPWELLPLSGGEADQNLLTDCHIRYAPTAGLALAARGGRRVGGHTGVYLGKLHPRDPDQAAAQAFELLAQGLPGCVPLGPADAPQGQALAGLLDRLLVLDDLGNANVEPGSLDWPLLRGQGSGGTTLARWEELPFDAPEVIVLPGFHTPAENSLKKPPGGFPGDELFQTICGLLAKGTRTVLISRWRTGGQTSLDLVREFTAGLADRESPDEAWQRAVLLVSESTIDFDREPRVDARAAAEPPRAQHPFFWSGYLLVDVGIEAEPPTPPGTGAAPPVAGVLDEPGAELKTAPAEGDNSEPAGPRELR